MLFRSHYAQKVQQVQKVQRVQRMQGVQRVQGVQGVRGLQIFNFHFSEGVYTVINLLAEKCCVAQNYFEI